MLAQASTSSRVTDVSIANFQGWIRSRQRLTRADVTGLVFASTDGRFGAACFSVAIAVAARMIGLAAHSRALLDLSNNEQDYESRKNGHALHLDVAVVVDVVVADVAVVVGVTVVVTNGEDWLFVGRRRQMTEKASKPLERPGRS